MNDVLQTVFDDAARASLETARIRQEMRYRAACKAVEAALHRDKTQRGYRYTSKELRAFYDKAELFDSLFSIYFRSHVPFACGPAPTDAGDRWNMWRDRMVRAEWEAYLTAARQTGMLDGPNGRDLLARLRSPNFRQFYGAMAECMVCWLLAGKYAYLVSPYVETVSGRDVECVATVANVQVFVEVKAPYTPTPLNLFRSIGPEEPISKIIPSAGKKFRRGEVNVVALVPQVDGISNEDDAREAYVRALYAHSRVAWDINTVTGESGPVRTELTRDGQFLGLRKGGFPANTRISAFLGVRTTVRGQVAEGNAWVDHELILAENPYAIRRLPDEFMPRVPRLTTRENYLAWSDGWPLRA